MWCFRAGGFVLVGDGARWCRKVLEHSSLTAAEGVLSKVMVSGAVCVRVRDLKLKTLEI